MPKWLSLSALLLALPLCAGATPEDAFPGDNLVGVQARGSLPGLDLASAVGSTTPGIGVSLQTELHFPPYRFDRDQCRFCARVEIGADTWQKVGASSGRDVTAFNLGVDGLYFLRDDGREFLNGPYLIAGVQEMAWTVGAEASGTGASERGVHGGYEAGLGCRLNRHLDAELKFLGSQADPALKVGAAMVCLDFWF
jgi:hypothetical protein